MKFLKQRVSLLRAYVNSQKKFLSKLYKKSGGKYKNAAFNTRFARVLKRWEAYST